MTEKWRLQTLLSLGFNETDATLYLYLASRRSQSVKNLSEELKMQKRQLYLSLKRLAQKGVASATMEHPAKFSVIPFDKVLDVLIKKQLRDARKIEKLKEEILRLQTAQSEK